MSEIEKSKAIREFARVAEFSELGDKLKFDFIHNVVESDGHDITDLFLLMYTEQKSQLEFLERNMLRWMWEHDNVGKAD